MLELEKELLEVSDPRSVQYGQHWSKERIDEISRNVAGSSTVREYLHTNGFTINEEKSSVHAR